MPLTRRKKIIYSLLTFVLVLVMAVGLMKVLLHQDSPKFYGNYGTDMFVDDTLLGYAAKPCTHITSRKEVAGVSVYNTDYNIGCNGLRNSGTNAAATKHLLFFGCSFTFGEGLPDSSTFPYLMNDGSYQTYNFGLPGYGPQQMLSRLESGKPAYVKEDTGIAIYTLLPDHIYRANGAPYVLANWGSSMPCYKLYFGQVLERYPSFMSTQPLQVIWYKALGFCGLMNVETIARPAVTEHDIELVAAMVYKSKELYLQRHAGSRFYVLAYPSASLPQEYERLLDALKKEGIEVLDYRPLFLMDNLHTIEGEGHPNALANKLINEQLRKDLRQ